MSLAALTIANLTVPGAGQPQDLSLTDSDGQAVSTAGFRGRVIVLMFSGIQDPQCRDEIKALESLAERYQGRAVSVYWVSINTASEVSNEKLKRPCGVTTAVPVLRLTDLSAFKRMSGRTPSLPTVVLLDKQGQIFGQPRSGFNPNSDFVNDIAQLADSLLARK